MESNDWEYIADQSHVDRIAETLWRPEAGRASVMIGAGFSNHALGKFDEAATVPNWSEISRAMYSKLYGTGDERTTGPNPELSAERSLALAQEYETAFGRAKLHSFLKDQIRNDDIQPGPAHTRLMKLPWRDVFTTNWDTLLERASKEVTSRSYEVLSNVEEMAIVTGPRIIKLHGSLPAQFPLIVTEDDYRKYPTQFAPFVNTVQQAMMETTFLLLGFSGRDPNFLQWSGWVRDQLGSSAPKIYLAGWLDLPAHERRVLERRNVVPIDLALHPNRAYWTKTGNERRYATEWLLYSLEQLKPYMPSDWPSPSQPFGDDPPNHLHPIKRMNLLSPQEEPSPNHDVVLTDVLRTWKHNRELYPGWLAIPTSRKYEFLRHTVDWKDKILEETEDFPPNVRIEAIYELVWRLRVLLEPMDPQLAEVAHELLEVVFPLEVNADHEIPVAQREIVRCICAELLAHERLSQKQEEFKRVLRTARVYAEHDTELDHIVQHEQCLWSLYSMDFARVRELLSKWTTDLGDPFWKVRKAALLLELGVDDGVIDLIRAAIVKLRRRGKGGDVIADISREAWASLFMDQLEDQVISLNRRIQASVLASYAEYDCDAWSELSIHQRALDSHKSEDENPLFDLGRERRKTSTVPGYASYIWGAEARRKVAVIRSVRLGEVMGLPPRAGMWPLTDELLSQAAEELYVRRQDFALRLLLRIAPFGQDKLVERVLSRARIARLPDASIVSLIETCARMESQSLPPSASFPRLGGVGPIERIRTAVEVRSRVSVRLKGSAAIEAFHHATNLYENRDINGHPWMASALRNLFRRTWEALRPAERGELALHVLGCPILGFDGFLPTGVQTFPDPGDVLGRENMDSPHRSEENEGEWQRVVSFLVRAVASGGETRARAAKRLAHIAIWNRFNAKESMEVASAIWASDAGSKTELPTGTNLTDWVFLLMPEPIEGAAREAFARKWTAPRDVAALTAETLDDTLWMLGDAKRQGRRYGYSMELAAVELDYIEQLITAWCKNPLPQPRPFNDRTRARTFRATMGCAELLKHMRVADSTRGALVAKLKVLEDAGQPGLMLAPAVIENSTQEGLAVTTLMRNALASDDGGRTKNATQALFVWLKGALEGVWITPPAELIREVGVIVATRRKAALVDSLSLVEWVFMNEVGDWQLVLKDLVMEGLAFLLVELDYGRDDVSRNLDVPLVRWGCARVAVAMERAGVTEDIVYQWIAESTDDPMPEVRNASDEIKFRLNS